MESRWLILDANCKKCRLVECSTFEFEFEFEFEFNSRNDL